MRHPLLIRIIIPVNTAYFNTYSTLACCNGDVIAAIFVEVILSYLFTITFIGANSKSRNKNIRGLIICGGVIIVALFSNILNYSIVNPVNAPPAINLSFNKIVPYSHFE